MFLFSDGFVSLLGLCNESYYGGSIRHLDIRSGEAIRSGEHIAVSPFIAKMGQIIT